MHKNTVNNSKRPGRPRALVVGDATIHREIRRLAALACTQQEVAQFLGVGLSTFTRYLLEDAQAGATWEGGLAEARISLRRKQFRLAEKSAAMAIFLGKQMLGQTDQVEQRMFVKRIEEMSIEELEWLLSKQQGVGEKLGENFGPKPPSDTEH